MTELVIVGAGPAGIAAAIQATRLGLDLLLLDASGQGGGLVEQAWRVENLPGVAPAPGPVIAARMRSHLDRLGVRVRRARARTVRENADGYAVLTDKGELHCRALLIATGTRARRLLIPGPIPIHTAVRDLLRRAPRRVAVIGGGEAALDQALTLTEAGCAVHVLIRGPAPRARGRLVSLNRDRLLLQTRALRTDTEGRLHVETPDGPRTLPIDGLLVAIGREPTLPRLPEQAPPVIGDARLGALGQIGIAVGDGLRAAMRLAGETP